MISQAKAYPLQWPTNWPRTPAHKQGKSAFRTTFDKARRNLMEELRMLGAVSIVLSTNQPVRLDGAPYAQTRNISDPGVAIWFALHGKQQAMARDAYWDITSNIHALGHAIEHLRGLERHGGAVMVERAFTGFAALPPPGAGERQWWDVLELPRGASADTINAAFRRLLKVRHPDNGGSQQAMADLNVARDTALREIGG